MRRTYYSPGKVDAFKFNITIFKVFENENDVRHSVRPQPGGVKKRNSFFLGFPLPCRIILLLTHYCRLIKTWFFFYNLHYLLNAYPLNVTDIGYFL